MSGLHLLRREWMKLHVSIKNKDIIKAFGKDLGVTVNEVIYLVFAFNI